MIRTHSFKDSFGEAPKKPPLERRSLLQFVLEEGALFSSQPPHWEEGMSLILGGVKFKYAPQWEGLITPEGKLIRVSPQELEEGWGVEFPKFSPPLQSPKSHSTIKYKIDFIASPKEAEKILSYIRRRGKILYIVEEE